MANSTKKRTWHSAGDNPNGGPADALSSRVYYECRETGETCYRKAGWRPGQRFVDHGRGIGYTLDSRGWVVENGVTYPASEF